MKDIPILFSYVMAKAVFEDGKTMTRRVVKEPICIDKETYADAGLTWYGNYGVRNPCPYGETGDRLWVKESHYAFGHWERIGIIYPAEPTTMDKEHWKFVHCGRLVRFDAPSEFRTSRSKVDPARPQWYKRNSLFMPKWSARTWLERTDTRIERLNDISEQDAIAEGVAFTGVCYGNKILPSTSTPIERFNALWESINGVGSWAKNDWVWVIGFKRVKVGAE